MTYYEQGSGEWKKAKKWVGENITATSLKLSGSSTTGGAAGTLTTGAVTDGTSDVLPIPVAGLCTRSANQWTAGAVNVILKDNPCFTDNKLNDQSGVVFETPAATSPITLQGPINARLYTSSVSGDGMLSVSVSDVAPDGKVSRLTGGWQVISHRALDTTRTRYVNGKILQPYHPFTKAAQKKLAAGEIAPIDVEVFPTGAKILPGHKLRLAVQAFDVPHLLPTLPDLLGTVTVMTIHNSAAHPSELTIPGVGAFASNDVGTSGARVDQEGQDQHRPCDGQQQRIRRNRQGVGLPGQQAHQDRQPVERLGRDRAPEAVAQGHLQGDGEVCGVERNQGVLRLHDLEGQVGRAGQSRGVTGRISPSWATVATKVPSWAKTRAVLRPRAPDADGDFWSYRSH